MRRILTFKNLISISLVLAAAMMAPAFPMGLVSTDYVHKALFTGSSPIIHTDNTSLFGMFSFSSGSPDKMMELVNLGVLPWWADLNVKISFFRPLAEITHWVDYRLWPSYPSMMHIQNTLWYLADILIVGFFARRIFRDKSPLIAGLAALMFAICGAHSVAVTWIANRNALMSTFFGILALFFHDKWRYESSPKALLFSLASLVTALLSAEYGLSAIPFLIGYAFFYDKSSVKQRINSLIPALSITLIYLLFYLKSGFGAKNSELYTSPSDGLSVFLATILRRIPEMLGADFSGLTLHLLGTPGLKNIAYSLYVVSFLAITPVLIRSAAARFLCIGTIGALVPVSSVEPSDRVLIFSSLGAMPIIAEAILYWWETTKSVISKTPQKIISYSALSLLILLHLIISPLQSLPLYLMPAQMHENMVMKPVESIQQNSNIANKTLILVNPHRLLVSMYFMPILITDGKAAPKNMLSLAPGVNPVKIERINEDTLLISPEKGFILNAEDWYPHSHKTGYKVGDTFHLADVTITIENLNEFNAPDRALFKFNKPLDDSSFVWLQSPSETKLAIQGNYVGWTPPKIGEQVVLKIE